VSKTTFKKSETFEVMECIKCGFLFAAPERFFDTQRRDAKSHYCVSCGRSQGWTRSENDRLRDQLKKETHRLERARRDRDDARSRAEKANLSRAYYKGCVTKIKNRVKNGVCPCCNRHFVNLERHMHGQHPEYVERKETK